MNKTRQHYRLGIDLGGTKISSIVLDQNDQIVHRSRTETPQGDYLNTVNTIASLVHQAEQKLKEKCQVGIGTPGTQSSIDGRMKNANSTCLNGEALKEDIERQLNREIRISNDANCFALSEAFDGSAKGQAIVFGVIIGTGTGAGIVVNNQIVEGANKISGEWGHNPMPWPSEEELPGKPCYCGRSGCIETFLSGPAFEADFRHNNHHHLTSIEIAKKATKGETECIIALERYEQRLAKSLAHVINILDPHVIVLGGGMSNISRLYDNVPKYWGQYVFSDVVSTQLKPPTHGDDSGVRGAARLWP